MIQAVRRRVVVYAAFASIVPKLHLAYNIWAWMQFFVQIISMTILVFFWQAVYAGNDTIAGLGLRQTLNYILFAQILGGMVENRLIFHMGARIREGYVAIELLRPVDFQGHRYVENLASLGVTLLQNLPLVLIAWLFFGLQLPSNPFVWGCFFVSLLLGHALLFCFDWMFACIAFYSTETWGLSIVREGFALFFSGALVPLQIMPDWLQSLTQAMPFIQALYVPVAFLSGITPVADAPRVWLVQIAWLLGLLVLSRLVFRVAVRKITVQGG